MSQHSFAHADTYGDIYVAAERAESWEGLGLPAGAQTRLWRALDRLKDVAAPECDIRSAEAISIKMHQLNLALRRPQARDGGEAEQHKADLATLARQWLHVLPMSLSRN